ncbi:hypothetical protein GCM10009077_19470 [Roseibium denhamense]
MIAADRCGAAAAVSRSESVPEAQCPSEQPWAQTGPQLQSAGLWEPGSICDCPEGEHRAVRPLATALFAESAVPRIKRTSRSENAIMASATRGRRSAFKTNSKFKFGFIQRL